MSKGTRKEGRKHPNQVDQPRTVKEDEHNESFERFEQFVKKIAQVPKEEVDEKRREEERGKRAG